MRSDLVYRGKIGVRRLIPSFPKRAEKAPRVDKIGVQRRDGFRIKACTRPRIGRDRFRVRRHAPPTSGMPPIGNASIGFPNPHSLETVKMSGSATVARKAISCVEKYLVVLQ